MFARYLEELRNLKNVILCLAIEPNTNGHKQLVLPGILEDKYDTPYTKLVTRLNNVLFHNALDKDTFQVVWYFLKQIEQRRNIEPLEAKDYYHGRKEVEKLPPGDPCTMQPYRGLRFDLEGRIYLCATI